MGESTKKTKCQEGTKQPSSEAITLVTHDGKFHYDEVLATAMLRRIYPNAKLIRTRNPEVFEKGDIVYDLGGVCDPKRNRFDHHQRSFTETYSESHKVKLSSAGLIYKYFRDKIFSSYSFNKEHPLYDVISDKIYNEFFLYADANDNGYNFCFEIIPRTLSTLVNGFNFYQCNDEKEQGKMEEKRFSEALHVVETDLNNYLDRIFLDYVPAYEELKGELVEVNGHVYVTDKKVSIDLIFDVNRELGGKIQLVVFKNKKDYRIYSLSVEKWSFTSCCPLPEKWRGLRDENLCEVSGIEGCTFVHASGFTGGNKTLEGAMAMCEAALKENGVLTLNK